jgi:hypothetical protein
MSRVNLEERLRTLREQALRRELRPDAWPRLQRRMRREPWRRAALVAGLALAVLVASVGPALLVRFATQPPVPSLGNFVPKGWKEYRDERGNYRFRYPPGWVVKPNWLFPGQALILPPESAAGPLPVKNTTQLPFFVTAQNQWSYYAAYGAMYPIATSGRLPGGQAFLQANTSDGPGRKFSRYIIDWGRFCSSDPNPDPGTPATDCRAHTQHVTIGGTTALWDRYYQTATTIVRSMAPLRATLASHGDRARPACRAEQWTLAIPNGWSFDMGYDDHGPQTWDISGGVRSLGHGPACHLRLTLQATVENPDGTPLRVPGTPATTTIEGDLPEDGAGPLSPSQPDLRVPESSTLHWIFSWENWCRQPLGQTRVQITAAGRSATQAAPTNGYGNCRNVSPTAPWRIVPLL